MASRSGNMKGFYRQRKSSGSISKKKKSPPPPPKLAAASSRSDTQPTALISHGSLRLQDDYDEHEEVLRQFDMNMAYGPCLGMTRLARWERARSLGLNPPIEIEGLLNAGKVPSNCLWDGIV